MNMVVYLFKVKGMLFLLKAVFFITFGTIRVLAFVVVGFILIVATDNAMYEIKENYYPALIDKVEALEHSAVYEVGILRPREKELPSHRF